jgi:hypothetical protein
MSKTAKPKPLNLKHKLAEKLEEYGEELSNQDVTEYILLLVVKCKKQKEELLQDLKEFFEDKTDEFVCWLCTSAYTKDKVIRCKFFPKCSESNCPYYHPTEIVEST